MIALTKDYGLKSYQYKDGNADGIDASKASWIVANTGTSINRYPFSVYDVNSGFDIIGGTVQGRVSLTMDWSDAYINSAAVLVKDAPRVEISNWEIDRPWDGIRIVESSSNFHVDNVWITRSRDDAIENDDGLSGTISNSLFDGVFVGLSIKSKSSADRSDNIVTLDNVLIHSETYLYNGKMTHGLPIKLNAKSPDLKIYNSIIAIEDVTHIGAGNMDILWDKIRAGSGNVFLNLTDDDLPKYYPEPPSGWTVLHGKAARTYWEQAKEEWISERGDGSSSSASTPEPGSPEAGDGEVFSGTSGSDRLLGTKDDDAMYGRGGADRLVGLTGNDTLVGGGGADKFIFNKTANADTNVKTISDFTPGTDYISLKSSVFSGLGSGGGKMRAEAFEMGPRADDASDRIIYTWKTGEVFYDADGTGSKAQILIAELDAQMNLNNSDFLVY